MEVINSIPSQQFNGFLYHEYLDILRETKKDDDFALLIEFALKQNPSEDFEKSLVRLLVIKERMDLLSPILNQKPELVIEAVQGAASFNKRWFVMKPLLRHGDPDKNTYQKRANLAVYEAAYWNHDDLVRFLIESCGADEEWAYQGLRVSTKGFK